MPVAGMMQVTAGDLFPAASETSVSAPPVTADAGDQKLIDASLKTARIHVEGDKIALKTGAYKDGWTIAGGDGNEEGQIRVHPSSFGE